MSKKQPDALLALQAKNINQCLEKNDLPGVYKAIEVLVKRKGVTKVAKEAGVSRSYLYKIFKLNTNPSYHIVAAILKTVGLVLAI